MAELRRRRWFLPETPDVIGLLREQLRVTTDGAEAFERWASGDAAAADQVSKGEERGDLAKRALLEALRDAFITPIEPEDLFTLSRGIDWVMNGLGDLVGESQVLRCPPDERLAGMAAELGSALRHVDSALESLEASPDRTTVAADAAIAEIRELRRSYYAAMAASLEIADTRERISRRELYRRCLQVGDVVVDVAERAVYSTVKES